MQDCVTSIRSKSQRRESTYSCRISLLEDDSALLLTAIKEKAAETYAVVQLLLDGQMGKEAGHMASRITDCSGRLVPASVP